MVSITNKERLIDEGYASRSLLPSSLALQWWKPSFPLSVLSLKRVKLQVISHKF